MWVYQPFASIQHHTTDQTPLHGEFCFQFAWFIVERHNIWYFLRSIIFSSLLKPLSMAWYARENQTVRACGWANKWARFLWMRTQNRQIIFQMTLTWPPTQTFRLHCVKLGKNLLVSQLVSLIEIFHMNAHWLAHSIDVVDSPYTYCAKSNRWKTDRRENLLCSFRCFK